MKLEILGTGCAKCRTLEENIRKAADSLGIPYELEKVSEIAEIVKRGVMMTPALMMDGRVKTLHPKIHGGLLGLRSNPEHLHDMNEYNIEGIDMIVVNVKPVENGMIGRGLTLEDAMNRIDIGGIALLRSAAKNFKSVTAVTDSGDYEAVIDEMRNNDGAVSPEMNLQLAIKVFETTSRYDSLISEYLRQKTLLDCSEKKYIEIPR